MPSVEAGDKTASLGTAVLRNVFLHSLPTTSVPRNLVTAHAQPLHELAEQGDKVLQASAPTDNATHGDVSADNIAAVLRSIMGYLTTNVAELRHGNRRRSPSRHPAFVRLHRRPQNQMPPAPSTSIAVSGPQLLSTTVFSF